MTQLKLCQTAKWAVFHVQLSCSQVHDLQDGTALQANSSCPLQGLISSEINNIVYYQGFGILSMINLLKMSSKQAQKREVRGTSKYELSTYSTTLSTTLQLALDSSRDLRMDSLGWVIPSSCWLYHAGIPHASASINSCTFRRLSQMDPDENSLHSTQCGFSLGMKARPYGRFSRGNFVPIGFDGVQIPATSLE
ncbi:hypothetical protein BDP27DRAFT_1359441 [Rhodocollybia butyracea]|uniref:Uncharacterized protein n=1 Tax=Rhodocollybia butyracea TaxID=206335 RepID=A0A9P5UCN0_9AGAR|nr:hypothetical protein BDP27DRAFT_1359441 [Rhodocollybia butyracea]